MAIGNLRTTQEAQPLSQLRAPQVIAPFPLTTSAQTVFTAESEADFWLVHFYAANVSGSADTVTVYIVPDGGSAAVGNMVAHQIALTANETLVINGLVNARMKPGDTLQALCGANAAVNVGGWGYDYFGEYA